MRKVAISIALVLSLLLVHSQDGMKPIVQAVAVILKGDDDINEIDDGGYQAKNQ